MDYRKTAQEIYDHIGKKENIISAAHCATRLRLVIADNAKADKEYVENIDGVKGVFFAQGQMQIILGTGVVNKVYDEFIQIAGISESSKEELKKVAASKANPFQRLIKTLGDIFVPIIPADPDCLQCSESIWRQSIPWCSYRHDHDSSEPAECMDSGNRRRPGNAESMVWTLFN